MKTAREVAHELEMQGKGCERWCSLDDDPEPPIHTPACNALTAAIEARDKEHATSLARERETALEDAAKVADERGRYWEFQVKSHPRSMEAFQCADRIRALRSPPTDGTLEVRGETRG